MTATCERCDSTATCRGLCNPCYHQAKRAGEFEVRDLDTPEFIELDMSWHVDALCAETDPEVFFPEKGQSTKPAKGVCRRCTVRAECLDYALGTRQRFGVWAGLSERERRKLLGLDEDDAEEASAA